MPIAQCHSQLFKKFVYWFDERLFQDAKVRIESLGIILKETRKAVCTPLAKGSVAGFVLPETWGRFELCKRQLSWYHSSKYNSKILLVSSLDFSNLGLEFEVVIHQSSFKPQSLPSNEDKRRLVQRGTYKTAQPIEWGHLDDSEIREQERRLRVMGLRGVNFEEIFLSHSANHANFIDPVFFLNEGNDRVPYSICKTSHVCSACLEWYNIVGSSYRKKLVVPCPGAVMFAGLVTNRYYEVRRNQNSA